MSESKIKHLEFIQTVIQRQANSTFQIKAWSVALLVGLAGLSRLPAKEVTIAGIGSVCLFWILDAYYLSKERKFRALYDSVRVKKDTDFSMDISQFQDWKCSWLGSITAIAVVVPYGAMLIGIVIFNFVR